MDKPYICYRGTYSTEKNQVMCQACDQGFYCDKDGINDKKDLKECQKGYYCPIGSWQPVKIIALFINKNN